MSGRHTIRDQMAALRPAWRAKRGPDHVHEAGVIGQISQTRLTGSTETLLRNEGLPATFVPGRNLLFLTLAAALAYRRGLKHLVTGVCETDFSGYTDCRDDKIKPIQVGKTLGTAETTVIHTTFM